MRQITSSMSSVLRTNGSKTPTRRSDRWTIVSESRSELRICINREFANSRSPSSGCRVSPDVAGTLNKQQPKLPSVSLCNHDGLAHSEVKLSVAR